MKKIFAVMAGAVLSLSACMAPIAERKLVPMTRTQIQEVERAVAYKLKDPSSAQFREIRMIERTHQDGTVSTLVCGQVNGKNSFGGYVGFTTFNGVFNGNAFKPNGIGTPDNSWLYEATCNA
ncbi:hypothetical protein [Thalassovita sp.]|uniref:hypothetical protein n=1 Tax=Thalassovita sp. TaxID=1979401 RepID=UPI003B5C3B03